jgi:hypothetical protein
MGGRFGAGRRNGHSAVARQRFVVASSTLVHKYIGSFDAHQ